MRRLALVSNDRRTDREIRFHFEEAGFRVNTFADPQPGLRAVRERRFDLVLVDLDLTGSEAISIARELRERGSSPLPMLIFVTPDEDLSLAALQKGADYCSRGDG